MRITGRQWLHLVAMVPIRVSLVVGILSWAFVIYAVCEMRGIHTGGPVVQLVEMVLILFIFGMLWMAMRHDR